MRYQPRELLRRTFAVLGASFLLGASLPVASQGTVTLSTGASCQYSQMTVLPNGSIQVTCQTTTTPPPTDPNAATFAVVGTTTSGAPNSTGSVNISRTGGPATETIVIQHTLAGSCHSGTAPLAFAPNQTIQINYVLLDAGSCTISIAVPSPHIASTPSWTIGITSTGGGGTNPPPPPGCPAPPTDYLYQTMDKWHTLNGAPATEWNSVDQLRMKSGQIATYDVIAPPTPNSEVVQFTQGQQPASPANTITEMSVSKCPGVIDTTIPDCYSKGVFNNNNQSPKIYRNPVTAAPGVVWDTQEELAGRGCWAPIHDATGAVQKWYVNVRWTFAVCNYGAANCGFSMQWAQATNW